MGIESNKIFSDGLPLQPASSLPLPASAKDKYGASASTAGDETVCGEITRVVYSSPDGSYCVVRFKLDSGENVTLVGPLADLGEGLNLEATGRWETHREHGRQFRVISFCPIIATSKSGILKYLGSGALPGVGEVLAARIVDHFGESTIAVLDNSPDRLQEVEGIGRKKLEEIKRNWRMRTASRDSMIFLQGLGISPAYCIKIIGKYSASLAPEIVRQNPYRLAAEIDGIGFATADRIANELGIEKNHPKRLCAGIVFALEELSGNGHVCCPDAMLVDKASNVLGVSLDEARLGLQIALEENHVQSENFPGYDKEHAMIYLRQMRRAEVVLAKCLLAMSMTKFENAKEPSLQMAASGMSLNDEQMQGYRNAFIHPLSLITGGPGVGKTTVISQIVSGAHRLGLNVALAAPTGRAAKRMTEATRHDAMTIHRLLKWDPERARFIHDEANQLDVKMLVVDEVSMLDINLASALFKAIPPGTRVVLVGDRDQLPSVGPGNVLCDLIECGLFPVTYLTQIYRQAQGSRIITNAHRVNHGNFPDISAVPSDVKADFYWIEQNESDKVADWIQRMFMERIPTAFDFNPMSDIQILSPMRKGTSGVESLNRVIQNAINPPDAAEKPQFQIGERLFRLGDKVMQTSNNYDKNVFNGEMGRIISMDTSAKKFVVLFDTAKVEYKFSESEQLDLSYAVTVHKSQGSEFPVVIMPLITQHYIMLQRNLLYTGMTRAKKLLVMIGSQQALHTAIANNEPTHRISMLRERLKC